MLKGMEIVFPRKRTLSLKQVIHQVGDGRGLCAHHDYNPVFINLHNHTKTFQFTSNP